MPIDTTRKPITPSTIISMMTIHDWPAILFGLPFMAMGGFFVAISLGIIPCDESKFQAPHHVVTAAGGAFFAAGFWVFSYGLLTFLHRLEKERMERNWPTEIWRADYRWDPRGVTDRGMAGVGQKFFSAALGAVLIFPFNWIIFSLKQIPGWVRIFIIIFDVWVFSYFIGGIYQLLRCWKYKTSCLEFGSFPFFLGDKMEAVLLSRIALQNAKNLTVTLRCVEEKYETRDTGDNRSQVVVAYQIYAETLEFSDLRIYGYEALRIPLSFSLPLDAALETRLRDRPARYWELLVKAPTPGINYAANFLVPVYKRNS